MQMKKKINPKSNRITQTSNTLLSVKKIVAKAKEVGIPPQGASNPRGFTDDESALLSAVPPPKNQHMTVLSMQSLQSTFFSNPHTQRESSI